MTAFINFISNSLLHTQHNSADGREFVSVSLSCPKSQSGFGTIAVSLKQILPARKKDGTIVDGFSNILLGDADRQRKVSILTPDGYQTIEMTNSQIADMFDAERTAWKAAAAAPALAEA